MVKLGQSVMFESILYRAEVPEYLNKLNEICDKGLAKARKIKQKEIKERNERYGVDVGDHGMSYHTTRDLYKAPGMEDFESFVRATARNILESQGFDLSNYKMNYSEMWVQQFADRGGGHHETHVHWDNHISGFYFLKCSDRTSQPKFHDPRPGRMMMQLPLKDVKTLCAGMDNFKIKLKPGTLIFFNSYLPHEFKVDNGIDPFRFIHFNIKATRVQLPEKNA